MTVSVILNDEIYTIIHFASCSETVGFKFEIFDVFHSLSELIRMMHDVWWWCARDWDVFWVQVFTCKIYFLKQIHIFLKININCIIQYFVFLSLDKDFRSAGKSEPLTYFICGERLIRDTTYLQLPQLKKANTYTPGMLSGKDF